MHYSVEAENNVSYFVDGMEGKFESHEVANAAGDISGVELSYFCPRCDAPNAAAYSVPIPEGLKTQCSECGTEHTLIESTDDESSTPDQYGARKFEDIADTLEQKRNVRRVGQLAGRDWYKAYRRRRILATLAGVGVFLTTFASGVWGLITASSMLADASVLALLLICLALAVLVVPLYISLFVYDKFVGPVVEQYEGRFDVKRWMLGRYSSYLRTGVRLSEGTASVTLYEPPPDDEQTGNETQSEDSPQLERT